ncbi:hypothetical protein GOFOIKOB_2770 [Methylobacterium tardum]|uniref:Uncharacterized protein n=1 Tax=Methylobacterium tardum TaxID=374432 RepID=A0AA37TIZ7_9HYPH|nr:hypothetical protein [Methylobacterium tardum]URD35100.1 hypothetical protein M6G65_21495 [Methylobacterium tardum]GJE49730.1 hypothetical protein GOFOIKOB_2770 [Methylobacterium tardum]GLS73057.1 hypothetical protein GCM10007890_50720 [Methylobacterium tardum]
MNTPAGPATRPYDRVEISVSGAWGEAPSQDVLAVLLSVRDCCLAGVQAREPDAPRVLERIGLRFQMVGGA